MFDNTPRNGFELQLKYLNDFGTELGATQKTTPLQTLGLLHAFAGNVSTIAESISFSFLYLSYIYGKRRKTLKAPSTFCNT